MMVSNWSMTITIVTRLFSQSSNLIKHSRIHTSVTPYRCDNCCMVFSRKSNLVNHLKTHNGEKPHAYSVCDKPFTDRSDLKTHIKTNTGENYINAGSVINLFLKASNLTRHKGTHRG